MALTDKQRRFCEEYLLDFNGSQAYRRAGYSPSSDRVAESSSSRLLRNVEVQAYLSELRDRASQSTQVTVEAVLQEISYVALARLTDVCSFDSDGVVLHDSATLPEAAKAAVQSVKSRVVYSEEGRVVTHSAVMHNKMAALGYLCDFFGIRDDFNKARATLKRYGLLVIRDAESPTGWTIRNADIQDNP